MKPKNIILVLFTIFTSVSFKSEPLQFCHKWQVIGYTDNDGKYISYKNGMESIAGNILISPDGSFRKELKVYGTYIYSGLWKYNDELKTLVFTLKEFSHGEIKELKRSLLNAPESPYTVETKQIIKLTKDTLVLRGDNDLTSNCNIPYVDTYYLKIAE